MPPSLFLDTPGLLLPCFREDPRLPPCMSSVNASCTACFSATAKKPAAGVRRAAGRVGRACGHRQQSSRIVCVFPGTLRRPWGTPGKQLIVQTGRLGEVASASAVPLRCQLGIGLFLG